MKFLRYFVILFATLICGNIFAQESQKDLEQLMKNRGEYYFSLTVQKPTEIQAISDLCSVDGTDGRPSLPMPTNASSTTCFARVTSPR